MYNNNNNLNHNDNNNSRIYNTHTYVFIKVCIGGMEPTPPLLLNWHIVLVVLSCGVFVGIMIASYWTYRSWKEQRNAFFF